MRANEGPPASPACVERCEAAFNELRPQLLLAKASPLASRTASRSPLVCVVTQTLALHGSSGGGSVSSAGCWFVPLPSPSVCMSVRLAVCMSVRLAVCMYVLLCVCMC